MADKPPTIADQPKSSITFDKTGMSISHTSPFSSQFTSSLSSFHQSPHHPVNSQPFQRNQMPLTSPSTSNSAAPAPIASMASNSITVADRPLVPMGPPPAKEMKKFDINSLMSPPDPVQDSFHVGRSNFQPISMARSESNPSSMAMVMGAGKTQQHSSKHPLPMSPPISPYSHHVTHSNATTPPSHSIRDPVLYPIEDGSPSSPSHQPLFGPAELEDHQRIVENHVRARSTDWFGRVAPPKHEDYALVLSFRSHVMKKYSADRKGWLRKEREFLEADRKAGAQRYHHIMPAKPIVVKPARSIKGDRISKPTGSQAPRSARANGTATPATARSAARRVSATPEPSRRIVAPNREDKDFNSLRDLCPPLASLPNRPNSLKVDWKGQPLDLSHDPHVHLLHPDEVALAGGLRLDCATYLTSKRRIFERRLQCLRIGKDFRKTDAQQACKIDVNKASKLWTAFDKVGWLDAHWVRRFL